MSDSRRTVFLSGAAVMLASILLLAGFSIFNRYLYTPKHPAPGKKILSLKNHPEKPADDSEKNNIQNEKKEPADLNANTLSENGRPRPDARRMVKIYVKWGDTLKNIARREYGSSDQWPYIYFDNTNILKSPDVLIPVEHTILVFHPPQGDLGKLYLQILKYYEKRGNIIRAGEAAAGIYKYNRNLLAAEAENLSEPCRDLARKLLQ
ncbi:MAG: hypothetical protein A2096_13935 [Spirochaetes bacterium GWF1_41_5]|nr:MAG: hypothetical protein A2096_13935 [Spirochaetes bacterium GWF1_41_5]HBE02458.1 hypothetical protein [Spirochaetia bacterium]